MNNFELVASMAADAGVTLDDLYGPSRKAHLVELRRRISVRLHEDGVSYPEIGRLLNRHHTTILHHVREWHYAN